MAYFDNSTEKKTSAVFKQSKGDPIDLRFVANTTEDLSFNASFAYEGCLCYCVENKTMYQYNGTQFVEFKSGDDVKTVSINADGKVVITLDSGKVITSAEAFVDHDSCKISSINNSDATEQAIYAPTAAVSATAKKGMVLVFQGQGATPTWVDVNTLVSHPAPVIDDGTL